MAINAVVVGGCGNEPHRVHEFIHRDSLEHGNVFESLFRHKLLGRRSLTGCRWNTQQPKSNRRHGPECEWPRCKLHTCRFLSVSGEVHTRSYVYFLSSPPTPPKGRPSQNLRSIE